MSYRDLLLVPGLYQSLADLGQALQLFLGIHAATAVLGAAVAGSRVVDGAVPQAVVVGELLAGGDVAQRDDPDLVTLAVGLTVRVAGMVDKGGHTVAVDAQAGVDP